MTNSSFDASARYTPDETEITAKVIDGEAIIINLLTGVYYSLQGSGAVAWDLIAHRRSLGEVVAGVAGHYGVEESRVKTDLAALLIRLHDEKMLRAVTEDDAPLEWNAPQGKPEPYATPELESFDDMAEVLALDPPTPGVFDTLLGDDDSESR